MNTSSIVTLIFSIIAALILISAITISIQNRRKPLDERKAIVLRRLRENESKTGTTSIQTGHGVTDDTIREVASTNGFEWAGYSGQNNRQMNFQRVLSGQSQEERPHRETAGQPTEQEFLTRLTTARPDIRGLARVDMTDFEVRTNWRSCMDLARAHGWILHSLDYQRDGKYWVLAKQGTSPVARRDTTFITGPGLTQLRGYPQARTAAEQAERELGVNPLSDQELDRARTQHATLWRKATRYGGLAAVCGLALLVLLFIAPSQFHTGGTPAIVISVIGIVLVLGSLTSWLIAARTLRTRKTALHQFTEGYERVVAAVLTSTD